jgi:hypothetical protein
VCAPSYKPEKAYIITKQTQDFKSYHQRVVSEPGIMVHTSNPSTWGVEAEDQAAKASLGYTEIPCLKNQEYITVKHS